MAISIKRAIISYRNIHPLIRASRRSSHFAAATSSLRTAADLHPYRSSYPWIGFLYESRRSFAKSRKKCNSLSIFLMNLYPIWILARI
ncbi:hypothetical protein Hdeb2414_s0536g00913251 [Helianthus debilis subsp. tardiflorus]